MKRDLKFNTIDDFENMWFRETPIKENNGRAEWYCENTNCIVREVRIHSKTYTNKERESRTVPLCPRCGKHLKFHHFIEEETIIIKR